MRFFLGTHIPNWLEAVDVPLFVSHRRLENYRTLPVARGPWTLDSGGFTELGKYGGWRTTEDEYVEAVHRYKSEIGWLQWAAPMDWMCEPAMLAETGLSVREHQERTVANFLSLRDRGPFIPVLQGWSIDDYEACVGLYAQAGVDLRELPLVGLGTVCRRHDTAEIARVVNALHSHGLRLHGFGMKSRGVARCAHMLTSADSMSWSSRARNEWHHEKRRLCGGDHKGGCANCLAWALAWRDGVVSGLGLFGAIAA